MRRRTHLLLLLLLGPIAAVGAQSGTVIYDRAVRHAFVPPEGMPEGRAREFFAGMPAAQIEVIALQYSPEATVMAMVPEDEHAEKAAGGDARSMEMAAMRTMIVSRMKAMSTERSDHEVRVAAHTDLDTEAFTEVRTFMGRTFRLTGERPRIAWKLSGEQSRFLDRLVMKATAEHEGEQLEAWFTPEIPLSAGPGPYGGLPGLILALTVDEDRIVYSATAIDTTIVAAFGMPKDGNEVTREEYEKIVADKLEELSTTRRRGAVRLDRRFE